MLRSCFLFIFFLALAQLATHSSGYAQSNDEFGCGGKKIEIADLQWPSATILAHIHAKLISQELGCDTNVVTSDLESVTVTLKTAQRPTLVPEMWPTRVADRWNQTVEARAISKGGPTYDNTQLEGWFVPTKVVEDFPALGSVENLKDMASLYLSGSKPKFVSCPPDWACALINRNMLKAHGLLGAFEVIEPENRIQMDQLIGQMSSTNEPMVFYYWQPNALLEQLDVTNIDLGAFDADAYKCFGATACATPKPSSFPTESINLVIADWVRGEAPELVPYARKAQMPVETMNQLLAKMIGQNQTPEQVAEGFLLEREDVWRSWLPLFDQ